MSSKEEIENNTELIELDEEGIPIEQKNQKKSKKLFPNLKLIISIFSFSMIILCLFFISDKNTGNFLKEKNTSSNSLKMYLMRCKVQNYDWGKNSATSLLSTILKINNQEIDSSKKYAEYWMGSHINGPSEILVNGKFIPLRDYLKNSELKYLFKVLTIEKPLSIQLHPNLKRAGELYKNFPKVYKDPNHKPEMFVPISEKFELLFGMKSLDLAYETLNLYKDCFDLPEAKEFLKNKDINHYSNFIKKVFILEPEVYEKIIDKIVNVKSNEENNKLINLLIKNYGKDLGILVALFMNHLTYKKGETLFIGPDFPHSYLSGDCFEVMANSDNVIRLGLTPKFKDKDTFKSIVDDNFNGMIYDVNAKNQNYFDFVKKGESDFIKVYHKDGFDDFVLKIVNLEKDINLKIQKNSILFIAEGKLSFESNGNSIKGIQYQSFFIANDMQLNIKRENNEKAVILIVSDK